MQNKIEKIETKQAILVTAYKNEEQLIDLIESLCEQFLVYIHIDKKSTDISCERIAQRNYKNVTIISSYSIVWGGYSHVEAILELMKIALQDQRISYIHIISGEDILVKSYSEFKIKFDNSKEIYMTCTHINETSQKVKRRLDGYAISANFDSRKVIIKLINAFIYALQFLSGKRRNKLGDFTEIYKGMVWVSLPSEVANYIITFLNSNSSFVNDLHHTTIPEEFFFQTIIMNSKYKENVICDNLRYTDWTGKNGSIPSYLDESDFNQICDSNSFFARKINKKISGKLIQKCEEQMKREA